jgi:hypothetical protein
MVRSSRAHGGWDIAQVDFVLHHVGSQEREREPVNVRLYELMSAIDPPAPAMPLGTLG